MIEKRMRSKGYTTARVSRTIAFAASLGMAFLTGCGGSKSSSSSSSSGASTTSSGSSGSFSDRAYATAASVALGTGSTGTLTVSVGASTTAIAGTLNLVETSATTATTTTTTTTTPIAVPLMGTLNAASGAFSLSGTVTENSTAYSAAAAGTLSNSTAGSVTITVNGTKYTAALSTGTAISGQLSAAYFPLTSNADRVYEETYSVSGGTPTANSIIGFSFVGGYGATDGATTQVTLNDDAVNKTAVSISPGDLSEYFYDTTSTTALTEYGSDTDISSSGTVGDSERYSPAHVIPFTLGAGQTDTQTVQVTNTSSTATINTYSFTESTTFNDFETIAVPGGTYTASKVTTIDTETIDASISNGFSSPHTIVTTSTEYLVLNVGVVQEHDVEVDTVPADANAVVGTYTTDIVLTSTPAASASAETKSVTKSVHAGRFLPPGIFGLRRGTR